ncbi:MAG TPA: PsbP-related protein, partial [Patescibacteria group bacterium]|nr:PsbP-related protein [Patescibacteria group bacterium]
MNKKIVLLSMLFLPMILVGASCTTSTEQTNANKEQTAASVTPASSVENSATPAATPENENTNSSSVDTSDWLTYENAEYGFSLKYPKNWTVNATTTPGHSNIIIETAII